MRLFITLLLSLALFQGIYAASASKTSTKTTKKPEDKIEVTAKTFTSINNITVVKGDVFIKKGKDTLNADLVKIYTDSKRRPLRYEAFGNVKFHTFTEDGRELRGSSKKLIYNVVKKEYSLIDDAFVKEVNKPNVVKGDLIVLDSNGEYANVVGNSKQPAHVTFLLDDKDSGK
ncbi:lipopolysaccharide transport periplasmic protein LptA [Helicobacter sp. 11S02629-2]|uniref:lipopolysaccharide transport periplasmic protein LptA n=1 Tax=Helicobacter sp. 11S02629-2 TaxID=1476195 RepID=UPI000BA7215D|nr:lipopolysaccharide transport periplasmic protein LptA [Helicobacter sp. 11S02629-2]PAF43506.1 lipopolysaccharide transport periplasmic protein LptA [Helicobacter sp. 11S02629-2]